ncbi:hypothetical protein F0562_022382 [Nyssa sinensis]|uniref:Uncharacterized protein n=1 Tax=Nyssa sinensis TaxID=561372 RepID=A0A5J5BQF4_9ASTE|nr:hypothetical protein F0562_022382 [Nyssa sinensis]
MSTLLVRLIPELKRRAQEWELNWELEDPPYEERKQCALRKRTVSVQVSLQLSTLDSCITELFRRPPQTNEKRGEHQFGDEVVESSSGQTFGKKVYNLIFCGDVGDRKKLSSDLFSDIVIVYFNIFGSCMKEKV